MERTREATRRGSCASSMLRHTADNDPPGTIVFVEREPGGAGKAYVGHQRGDVMPPSWRKGCGRLSTRYAFMGSGLSP